MDGRMVYTGIIGSLNKSTKVEYIASNATTPAQDIITVVPIVDTQTAPLFVSSGNKFGVRSPNSAFLVRNFGNNGV